MQPPENLPVEPGRVLVIEAPSLRTRSNLLQEILTSAQDRLGGKTWLLSCSFHEGGLWAGVDGFFGSLLSSLEAERPDLVRRHDYELVHVLPALKKVLDVRNPNLTDLSLPEERVRNYPADRAIRIVHGLIDLLDEWKKDRNEPWILACDSFDEAGHTAQTFFRELMRRRGQKLGIALIAVVAPGRGERAMEEIDPHSRGTVLRVQLSDEGATDEVIDRNALEEQARSLEAEVRKDRREMEVHLPNLIRLWRLAGRPEKVAEWQFWGLDVCDAQGFYEEAIAYGEEARKFYGLAQPGTLHWPIFVKLFMSYLALQQPEKAYRLAEEDAVGKDMEPRKRAHLHYLLSMLHSRYLPARDLRVGEEHLDQGLEELGRAGMSEEDFHFQSVFNRNGLAMIRHFQGRYEEAIELCRQGFEELEAHLSPEKHRLHRSVLLFNLAQVYAVLGEADEAIRQFTSAIEMDPNYSEYFNDRGSTYLKMGRLEEARTDYLRAIELSPPYAEVFVNLGQCYRSMGEMEKAIDAYSVALDLDPARTLALAGRGQCHEAEGRLREALEDYSAALSLDPKQWDVLASRAILLYECGDLDASLADLNQAISLAPHMGDLYQNRSVALADKGLITEAVRDLESYLELAPDAEDRLEVEARLSELETMRRTQAVA